METEKIKVVLCKVGEKAEIIELPNRLKDLQDAVNGYIERFCPFDEPVCIICNEEGKVNGSEGPNRAIHDKYGDIIEIMFGTFFICGYTRDNLISLSDEAAERYRKLFEFPEIFARTPSGKVISMKCVNPKEWKK